MGYTIIHPLGERLGFGSFDTIYDTKKYSDTEEAFAANDYVILNFVEDSKGIIYFEIYHVQDPDRKKYIRLDIQRFPFGIDALDDRRAMAWATKFFK